MPRISLYRCWRSTNSSISDYFGYITLIFTSITIKKVLSTPSLKVMEEKMLTVSFHIYIISYKPGEFWRMIIFGALFYYPIMPMDRIKTSLLFVTVLGSRNDMI